MFSKRLGATAFVNLCNKDAVTTAQLPSCTVDILTERTSRSPNTAEQRYLQPGMDETKIQLPKIRWSTAHKAIMLEHQNLLLSAFCADSQCNSSNMKVDIHFIQPNLGISQSDEPQHLKKLQLVNAGKS